MNTEQLIWNTFKIQTGDVVPFVGKTKPNRNDLAKLFGKAEFKLGAEIGVRRGNYSKKLLQGMGDGRLILVDPWSEFHGHTGESADMKRANAHYNMTMRRLEPWKDKLIIKKMTSIDALSEIEDESLDFIYIDALHDFDNFVVDLIGWSKKVRPNGIVSGHDYHTGFNFGVIEAVNAYTRCHNIDFWYLTREGVPSFFWVKK